MHGPGFYAEKELDWAVDEGAPHPDPAMTTRNYQTIFRKAAWSSPEDLTAYVRGNHDVPDSGLRQLFEVMVQRAPKVTQGQRAAMEQVLRELVGARPDAAIAADLVGLVPHADDRARRVLAEVLLGLRKDATWHAQVFPMLSGGDARLRAFADWVLSRAGGKTVLGLIEETAEESWPSRKEVVHTLVEVAGHYAIPVLLRMLPACDRDERLRVVQLLSEERYMKAARAEACAALRQLLGHEDARIRGRACAGLGQWRDGESAALITELVWDENRYVARTAVGALAALATPEAIATIGEVSRIENIELQTACVDALVSIGNDAVVPDLVRMLESEVLVLRNKATEALSSLGRSGKVDLARMLVLMMNSSDVQVRRAVIEIINDIGDREGKLWRRLVRHLRDEDWWVRERATEVLVNIAGSKMTEHVIELLDDPSDIVRRYAVEVLIRLQDRRSVPRLAQAAKEDGDWWVQERAIEALGELGDQRSTPVLVNLLTRRELHWVCVEALGRLGDPRAVPYLGQLLKGGSQEFRIEVLGALEGIGTPEIVDEVRKVAEDVDRPVRERALAILESMEIEVDGSRVDQQVAASKSFVDQLLETAKERGATDVYIVAGGQPAMKVMGVIQPLHERVLSPEETRRLGEAILSEKKLEEFRSKRDVDTSYESRNEHYRFRVNVYTQHGGVNVVFRVIADEVLPFEQLNLPDRVLEFTSYESGLVLIAGPSASGKSTTLTTLMDHVNREQARHIITLEDPIEYVHGKEHKALVNQREIGTHARDYLTALRSVLREDPDVILVGELRDKETIGFAVTAAETGHLVFGTLHTVSAAATIDRILDAFPPHQQPQIRVMIAESLRGVLCQQLLMRANGDGRVLALELMLNNHAIANMIRNGKTHQIPGAITTSYELGMRLMDREMLSLATQGVISPEEAYAKATDKKLFAHFFDEDGEGEGTPSPTEGGAG